MNDAHSDDSREKMNAEIVRCQKIQAEVRAATRERQSDAMPFVVSAARRCRVKPDRMVAAVRGGLMGIDAMPCPFTDAEIQAAIDKQPGEN